MTPKDLQKAEARYRRAVQLSEARREERNAAVKSAIALGWTYARIAEATGLSRARIGQIAQLDP